MPRQNTFGYKSSVVQIMAWCHQATSHYLRQWWPRSMSSYGVTSPQWGVEIIEAGWTVIIGSSNGLFTVWPCGYHWLQICFPGWDAFTENGWWDHGDSYTGKTSLCLDSPQVFGACDLTCHLGPFYLHGLALIPPWISNYMLSKL